MAVTITRVPRETPSATPQPEYTILTAIAEYAKGRPGVLMLMNLSTGENYEVVGYDESTGKTFLRGSHKSVLRVKITQREVDQYRPLWRD